MRTWPLRPDFYFKLKHSCGKVTLSPTDSLQWLIEACERAILGSDKKKRFLIEKQQPEAVQNSGKVSVDLRPEHKQNKWNGSDEVMRAKKLRHKELNWDI